MQTLPSWVSAKFLIPLGGVLQVIDSVGDGSKLLIWLELRVVAQVSGQPLSFGCAVSVHPPCRWSGYAVTPGACASAGVGTG